MEIREVGGHASFARALEKGGIQPQTLIKPEEIALSRAGKEVLCSGFLVMYGEEVIAGEVCNQLESLVHYVILLLIIHFLTALENDWMDGQTET